MRWWKVLGVAGLAGVAATGVLVAREERRRRAYTPAEIREQLHARLAAGVGPTSSPPASSPPASNRAASNRAASNGEVR